MTKGIVLVTVVSFLWLCALASNAKANVRVGDIVRVRNSVAEQWKTGEVTKTSPVLVKVAGSSAASAWSIVDRIPIEFMRSDSRNLLRKSVQFNVGDIVRVRNSSSDKWQAGLVSSTSPLSVTVHQVASFWKHIDAANVAEWMQKERAIRVGELVWVRNEPAEEWELGQVTQTSPILAKVGGSSQPWAWKEVDLWKPMGDEQRLKDAKIETVDDATVSDKHVQFEVGNIVRVRNSDSEKWQAGLVTQTNPLLVKVYRKGLDFRGKASSWKSVAAANMGDWMMAAMAVKFRAGKSNHLLIFGTVALAVNMLAVAGLIIVLRRSRFAHISAARNVACHQLPLQEALATSE